VEWDVLHRGTLYWIHNFRNAPDESVPTSPWLMDIHPLMVKGGARILTRPPIYRLNMFL